MYSVSQYLNTRDEKNDLIKEQMLPDLLICKEVFFNLFFVRTVHLFLLNILR